MTDPSKHDHDEYSSEEDKYAIRHGERPSPIKPEHAINPRSKTDKIKRSFFIIPLNIVLGILLALAVRYGSDYVYSIFRAENLTPEMPYAKEYTGKNGSVDVYLIPFDGFNEAVANQIANVLSQELNINVKASLSAPLDQAQYNAERKQFVVASFYPPIKQIIPVLKNRIDKTAYVALLNADMYPQDGNFNFLFSAHWNDRISVVAAGRLVPFGVLSKDSAQKIYGERLLKLVKRTIGQQYYGMPRSSNKKSIMYSPLMGLSDLDEIGYEF